MVLTVLLLAFGTVGVSLDNVLGLNERVSRGPVSFAFHTQLKESNRCWQAQVGVYGGQVLFYLLGIASALVGNYSRRLCIVLGVVDYDTNCNGDPAFEVPLLETDVWRVNDCIDTIRLLQHDFVLRQQRGITPYSDDARESDQEEEEEQGCLTAISNIEDEEYHSADEDEQAGGGAGPRGA